MRQTKFSRIAREELGGSHVRLWIAYLLGLPFPGRIADRLRGAEA